MLKLGRGDRMKLIINKNVEFTDEQVSFIEELGYTIQTYTGDKIAGDVYVGMLAKPFSEIDNIEGLKFIQSTIAGFDMLDMNYIKSKNITFSNASGTGSAPISEYVILKVLDYFKDANRFRVAQANKEWAKSSYPDASIQELENKRVMVLGTGQIGQDIAKRLQAFGCVLIGVNSNGRSIQYFDETYALDNVYAHLDDVDVVVGALPLNESTFELYDEKFFNSMQDGAIFINVGRGPSLKVDDAILALDNKLAHLYLDVMPVEPLPADSVLWTHPKVSLTPHNSSSSNLVRLRVTKLILDNLENYAKNKTLINKVI